MGYICASIINIELRSDKYVQKPYPKFLHGLCYHLAGKSYSHHKYKPPKFHPFISNWNANKWGTKANIKIANIDEKLKLNILDSLERSSLLRLGYSQLTITRFAIERQENISLDLSKSIPVPNEFKINFITPTKFRTRSVQYYGTTAYPDVSLLIRSISRNLHILYGVKLTLEKQEELAKNILLINAIGYPVRSKIGRTSEYEDGFVGELHLSCVNLDEEQKRIFGMLLRTAMYTGIGHKKGYGYGHIKINRPL